MAVFGIILQKGNSRDLSLGDPSISFLFPLGSLPLQEFFLDQHRTSSQDAVDALRALVGQRTHWMLRKEKGTLRQASSALAWGEYKGGTSEYHCYFIVNYFGSLQSIFNSSCTIVQDNYVSNYIIVFLVFIDMLMIPLIEQCLSLIVISMVFIDSSKLSLVCQCILSPSRGQRNSLD